MTMVKAKEKIKAIKKAMVEEGVLKSKDKKAKKKELLDMLRSSMADADEIDEPPKKFQKKKKNKSNVSLTEDQTGSQSPTDEPLEEDELKKLLYRPMPKKDRKVKLDPRFQEIYTNPEYSGVTRDTDERGALKLVKKSKGERKFKGEQKPEPVEESEDESQESEPEVDSEDEETDLEDELCQASDEEGVVWDQLDAPQVEYLEQATHRLCLKHMQWDRVTARDIFVLASSFLPPDGALRCVTIIPSEAGLAKLPRDERAGPAVIGALDSLAAEEGVTEWPGEGRSAKGVAPEELEGTLSGPRARRMNMCRQYEIERLGFFYAILVFDSPETANAVYEAIDGTEYESSGCRIDLYFVEDDRQVDKHLCGLPDEADWRAMITKWPESDEQSTEDLANHAPPNFVNNALRHTHQFGLSWDETPAERKQWLESLAEVDDINDDWQEENCPELSRYLAMSDSSDDEEEEERERKRQLIRSLLQEADKAEEKRKKRQKRGMRKGDDSDSDSDSEEEEEEVEVAEKSEEEGEAMFVDEEEEEVEEEKMETSDENEAKASSDDESNFFKIVAERRKEKLKKKQKKVKNGGFNEETSDEDMSFGSKKKPKKEKAGSSKKGGVRPTEDGEKTGKRKRKRLTKMQKAKQKLREKERPVDPELALLMSNFKRATKTPKEVDSKAVAEDPRFASIFKDPKFAKDPGSLVRLSARL